MVAQALVDGLELWWGKCNFSTTKSVPLLTSFGPLAALSPSQCWCNSRGQEGSPTRSKGNSTCKSWTGRGMRRGRWGQSQPQAPNRTKTGWNTREFHVSGTTDLPRWYQRLADRALANQSNAQGYTSSGNREAAQQSAAGKETNCPGSGGHKWPLRSGVMWVTQPKPYKPIIYIYILLYINILKQKKHIAPWCSHDFFHENFRFFPWKKKQPRLLGEVRRLTWDPTTSPSNRTLVICDSSCIHYRTIVLIKLWYIMGH